jgi:hypothetical protein
MDISNSNTPDQLRARSQCLPEFPFKIEYSSEIALPAQKISLALNIAK